jgi:hypothetical protein
MTAKIIKLQTADGIRHRATGVIFPQVYRVSSYYFDEKDGKIVPSERPAPIFYMLSKEDVSCVANPAIEPVTALRPGIDAGSVVVRRHLTRERAEGYLSAVLDILPPDYDRVLYATPSGLFSIIKLAGARFEGCPAHLLILIDDIVTEDKFHIVSPDGSVSTDDFILYPDEQEE